MLLTIGDYTVDIKARKTRDTRNSKDATMNFLCEFAYLSTEAAELHEERSGVNGLTKKYKQWFCDVYDALELEGYFDSIKNEIEQ